MRAEDEDHEAGIEAAHRLVAAYEDRIARLKTAVKVGMPADIAIDADVKLSIAMDADRDMLAATPSRVGSVAVEDVEKLVEGLRRIADGTWNVGTGRNLSAREFARDALAEFEGES